MGPLYDSSENITIILSIVTLVSEVGFPADYNFVAVTLQQELIRVLHLMSQGTRSQVRQTEMENMIVTPTYILSSLWCVCVRALGGW